MPRIPSSRAARSKVAQAPEMEGGQIDPAVQIAGQINDGLPTRRDTESGLQVGRIFKNEPMFKWANVTISK